MVIKFLIYHCVTCYRGTYVKFILPILLVVIYSYLYRRNADMDHWIYTDGVWLNEAVLRGLPDFGIQMNGICHGSFYMSCSYLHIRLLHIG